MGSLRQVLSCSLLLCLFAELQLVRTAIYTTDQDRKKCQLYSEDTVEFQTDVVVNGQTYYDVDITINEFRGYKCAQASGTGKYCKSSYRGEGDFYVDSSLSQTYEEKLKVKACRPTTTNHVTRSVDVTLGGNVVTVNVEWSNITECSCDTVDPAVGLEF